MKRFLLAFAATACFLGLQGVAFRKLDLLPGVIVVVITSTVVAGSWVLAERILGAVPRRDREGEEDDGGPADGD